MRCVAFCLVLVPLCNAQALPGKPDSERGLTEGLLAAEAREIERLYDVATLHNDGDWFQRMFADDYISYGPRGEVVNKEQYIRDLVSRDLVWDSVAAKDITIRIYGNTAIAAGRFFGKGKFKGTPLDERQRFTSVLIKRDGRWLIVAEHCSNLAPADQ